MVFLDGGKNFSPDEISVISKAYNRPIQLPILRGGVQEHASKRKRTDVYYRENMAKLMIRGKMPNDGTPDPFGCDQTPVTAMKRIHEASARLDKIRTHKI